MAIAPLEYRPDVAIPPGATIREILTEKGMTQAELAERMRRPAAKISEILRGKKAVTAETALALELVLGLPATFWLKLETNYQLTRKRIATKASLEKEARNLKFLPLNEMIRLGWVDKKKERLEQTRAVLAFFGVTSFSQIGCESVRGPGRKSRIKNACVYALAAWLRRGRLQACEIRTAPFSAPGLRASLGRLRSFSLLDPEQLEPAVVGHCARHGVAVVFVPPLPRTDAGGAAYWIADKAVVQLSARFRSNGQLWFALLHELGHILLHGKKTMFVDKLDFAEDGDRKEQEANGFASRALVPEREYKDLIRRSSHNASAIVETAQRIGIAPGVVVGMMQRDGKLSYKSHLNSLKQEICLENGHLTHQNS